MYMLHLWLHEYSLGSHIMIDVVLYLLPWNDVAPVSHIMTDVGAVIPALCPNSKIALV